MSVVIVLEKRITLFRVKKASKGRGGRDHMGVRDDTCNRIN